MNLNINLTNVEEFQCIRGENSVQISPLALGIIDTWIKDIKEKLDRPFKYLEFGSGLSTVYFSEKYPEMEIYSVEGVSDWHEKVGGMVTPKKYEFHEATNYYTTDPSCNMEYITCMEEDGPFDLILNDGAQREMVADYIFSKPEKFIAKGGLYLRHDYEMLSIKTWIGHHLPEIGQTTEEFAAKNDNYTLVTINGNGKWGYKCELGGVWHR